MNAIAKTSKNSRSPAPTTDRSAAAALDLARNSLFRDYPAMPPMLERPLAPDLRTQLELRSEFLGRCLAPAPKHEHAQMAAAIAGMLGAFGGNITGSVDALVSKYVHVMRDLPLWAVVGACEAVENGEAEGVSLDYRPAAPRLRAVAKSLTAKWCEEAALIREVLAAPALEPGDEAMRQRIGEMFAEFAAGLRMGKFKSKVAAE